MRGNIESEPLQHDERKELEDALLEYKEFFDESPVALFRTCIQTGNFLMANKKTAELLGFRSAPNLIENLKSTDLYPIEKRAELINQIKKRGKIENYEVLFKTPDGREIWVLCNLHINCGGGCIDGSMVDITELATLRRANLKMAQQISEQLALLEE